MENSTICSSDMVQFLDQMQTGEVNQEFTEAVVKQELREEGFTEVADEIRTLKVETVDCYGTEQYFNKPLKVEQIDSDNGDEFMKIRTSQNKVHIANECKESLVHCKDEEIDIKCEDLEYQPQFIDWSNGETLKKKRATEESSNKPKQAGNLILNLYLVCEAKSELDLYKCHECSYATRHAANIKRHVKVHKAKSGVGLYKCHECSFASKYAVSLKWHMLIRKPKSELDLYKCTECSLYKCNECSYAAKLSANLKKHMLTHKSKSEVDLYKCPGCSFATKYATSLRTHMLVHTAESEVDLYKCHECSFATKYAVSLKGHMLIHKAKS